MKQTVNSIKSINGTIRVPGDKSISHRAIMIGSIANGLTEIEGFLNAEDCLSTVSVFRQLGVDIEQQNETHYLVRGKGLYGLKEPQDVLNVGNSGTTIRLTAGILAGQSFHSILTGDNSIIKRPMGRVTEPLRMMGAQIDGRVNGKYAPLAIKGRRLNGINYTSAIASAQVKSALLLAGLYAVSETKYFEPYRSRDHTEKMLINFGANLETHDKTTSIYPGIELTGQKIIVPGDISSAAFFIAAALLVPDSKLLIENVGINPTRIGFLEAVTAMNGSIQLLNKRKFGSEEVADILIEYGELEGITITEDLIPRIIDELPLIAVLATQAKGITKVTGAHELRVKETDRIYTIATELRKLGIEIEELEDGFIVSGKQTINGGLVTTHGDHRIGMAMAIAGLIAEQPVVIENITAVNISYPRFFSDLDKISKY